MKNKYTLTTFIEDIITNYQIDNTEKNFKKIRIKFERELKKLGKWDNAEKKLIGKKMTRIFNHFDLKIIEINSRDYLLKNSKIDKEKYIKHIQECDDYLDNRYDYYDSEKNYEIEEQFPIPSVSNEEKIHLMIEAIFYKFFENIDIELWEKDLQTIHYSDEYDAFDVVYFNALNRLENKVKAYVKNKKD